jgi:putative transposase
MARKPRIHVAGGYYHVMLRGNNGQDIFYTGQDRNKLNEIMVEGVKRFDYKVHAYCWMTNHVHILIQVRDIPLSKIVQHIASCYAKYLNRMRKMVGHVFQGRFKSILIESDTYLLTLVRYIHQNPTRSHLVESIDDYAWSSHLHYLDRRVDAFVTKDVVFNQLTTNKQKHRAKYRELMELEVLDEIDCESGVKGESRVLGSDSFVGKYTPPQKEAEPHGFGLDDVIESTLAYFNIKLEDICSPSRNREFALARSIICYHANQRLGLTLKRLSELFGRNESSICKSIIRYQGKYPELFKMEIRKA